MAFSDHVKVKLGLDSKGFNDGLSLAEQKAQKFSSTFKNYFVGAIGGAVLARASKQIIQFGASIGDVSDRLGVSAEFLQAFQFGAEQSGVNAKSASIALQRFARRTAEAKEKGGELKETLDKVGVSLYDNNKVAKTSEQLFKEFGNALANMSDPAEKLRVAFKFLDTEGVALTQMFQRGGDSLDDFERKAKSLGLVLSNDNIRALQDASAELEKLGREFKIFGANILPPISKKFFEIVDVLRNVAKAFSGVSDVVVFGAKAIGIYFVALKGLAIATAIGGAIKGLALSIGVATKAMEAFNLVSKANPFVLIAGAITSLALLLDGMVDQLNDARNEFKRLQEQKLGKVAEETGKVKDATNELRGSIAKLIEEFQELTTKEIKLSTREQVDNLIEFKKLGKDIVEQNKKEIQQIEKKKESLAKAYEAQKKTMTDKVFLAETAKKLADMEQEIVGLQEESYKATNEQVKITKELEPLLAKLRDEEVAREEGVYRLIFGVDKLTRKYEQEMTLKTALATKDEKKIEQAQEQIKFENELVGLYERGNITMEDAIAITKARLANEKQSIEVQKEIGETKKVIADLTKEANAREIEALKIQKEKLQALFREQDGFKEARVEGEKQLEILRAKARGQNLFAQMLEHQVANEKAIAQIQQQQGLNLGDAVAKRREELQLLAKINGAQFGKQADEIKKREVGELAGLRIRDARDRKERERIRKAKELERVEKRIKDLQGKKGQEDAIKALNQRKDKLLDLVLSDDAKKELQKIADAKAKFDQDLKAQGEALRRAEQRLKAEQAEAIRKREQQQAQIELLEAQRRAKEKSVFDAGERAIREATKEMVNAIKGVQVQPQVNNLKVQPARAIGSQAYSGEQKVFVVNQLNQGTQDNILQTLKGYFVNQ